MESFYKVFVYGTLRQHESNHQLLKDARCLSRQCWTNGILYDTNNGYPAMATNKTNRVYGELYEVNAEQLKSLDWLEGYEKEGGNNDYERLTQTVYADFGATQAIVYVYSAAKVSLLEEIEFGDWKCHRYLKQKELLYFAYGSCMDDERICLAGVENEFTNVKGCGVAKNYSVAYTVKFHDGGRADLIESDESAEGKVYQISQEGLEYLFKREGVYTHTYRSAFIDVMIEGELHVNVLTFLVIDKQEETAPPIHYATEILRGAKGLVSDRYYQKLQDDLFRKFTIKM